MKIFLSSKDIKRRVILIIKRYCYIISQVIYMPWKKLMKHQNACISIWNYGIHKNMFPHNVSKTSFVKIKYSQKFIQYWNKF